MIGEDVRWMVVTLSYRAIGNCRHPTQSQKIRVDDPRVSRAYRLMSEYNKMSTSVAALFPERTVVPEPEELASYIRRAIEVQRRGMAIGKRPFGAILVGPDVLP